MSLAKLLGVLYVLMGIVIGIIVIVISLFSGGLLLAIFAPIGFGIIYGVIGFLSGFILALPYNFVAKKVGGIKFEVSEN